MNKLSFKKVFCASVLGAISMVPQLSNAALINNAFVPGLNTIQDSNADRILASDGTTVLTTGSFAVGQILNSILRYETVNSNPINSAVGSLNYGLWNIIDLEIEALVGIDTNNDTVIDAYSATFGSVGAGSTGTLASLYEVPNSTNFLSQDPNTAQTNIAAQGTLVTTFGLNGGDDFWTAILPLTIQQLSLPLASGQQPSGNFGISVKSNPGSLPIVTNGILGPDGNLHDVVGDVSAYSLENGVNPGWLVSTNSNASFNVPEPSLLGLLGVGSLMAAAAARRRRNV